VVVALDVVVVALVVVVVGIVDVVVAFDVVVVALVVVVVGIVDVVVAFVVVVVAFVVVVAIVDVVVAFVVVVVAFVVVVAIVDVVVAFVVVVVGAVLVVVEPAIWVTPTGSVVPDAHVRSMLPPSRATFAVMASEDGPIQLIVWPSVPAFTLLVIISSGTSSCSEETLPLRVTTRSLPLTVAVPGRLPPMIITSDGAGGFTCGGVGMVMTTLSTGTSRLRPAGLSVLTSIMTLSPGLAVSGTDVVMLVVSGSAPMTGTVQFKAYGVVLLPAWAAVGVRTTANDARARPAAAPAAILRRARARPGRLIMQSPLAMAP
jgi:hypothetical protein